MLAIGGTVLAQSDNGGEPQPEEIKQIEESDRSLVDEEIDSLSGEEKLNRGENKINKCKKNLKATNELLQDARKQEKDIRKINCINDKLAAIKGFLKVAEQSYVKLKSAVSENKTKDANHHYTLISVSKQKIDKLVEEARLCAGEIQRYADETQVQVNVDDEITDPPSFIPEDRGGLVTLPELTPYQ